MSEEKIKVNEITRIPYGATIRCTVLTSATDIRIDGDFEGRIKSEGKVVIGETAVIKGDIICRNADIWGRIDGDVVTSEILNLMSTAVFEGQVNCQKLGVENGARFNGVCRITDADAFARLMTEFDLKTMEYSGKTPARVPEI